MKAKFLILFFLISVSLIAQNTISMTLQPSDLGIGLRFDRQIKKSGLYIASSKGSYQISESEKISNHIKTTAGFVRYIKEDYCGVSYVSVGVTHHYYSNKIQKLNPVSFDMGAGMKYKRIMAGFFMDMLNWEGGINIGVNFNGR